MMTLLVLALDAADSRLINNWNLDSLKLCRSRELTTVTGSYDVPYTPEVWATVASGKVPEDHGVLGSRTRNISFPMLDTLFPIIARYLDHMPERVRNFGRDIFGQSLSFKTVSDNVFNRMYSDSYMWPGVDQSTDLERAWSLIDSFSDGRITESEFRRRVWNLAGKEIGWLLSSIETDLQLAGTHIHILDAFGHVYCRSENTLRNSYAEVASFIDRIFSSVREEDDLLILSDHGMNVEWLDDDRIGEHSEHAFISSTIENQKLPKSVLGVRSYIEDYLDSNDYKLDNEGNSGSDIDRQILRDLGYIK